MVDALIVVDMQNLFVDLAKDEGPAVLKAVNEQVRKALAEGRPIFYTYDYAPIDLPDGDPEGRTALHPELAVHGTVVEKGPGKRGGFSGFLLAPVLEPQEGYGGGGLGPLAGLLSENRVDSVTVVGIATDICVSATARDARRLGYPVTVPVGATAFARTDPDVRRAALAELRSAGVNLVDEER